MQPEPCVDCPEHYEGRAVDNTSWDAGPPMAACTSSDTPGSCFRAICAGRKAGPPEQRGSWALPHHKTPGSPPNAAGVRNSLARFSQTQGLTNTAEARRHLEAHMASIQSQNQASGHPPRDNLVRAVPGGFELREAADPDAMPTMVVDFARFNEWTEIDSIFEGRFMEQVDHGAFATTFVEDRDAMRVLFQHGRDPQIGDKVLGPIDELGENAKTARGVVPLLDTSYNRDLLPGLEAGLYGASFRFRVLREEIVEEPERSKHNPDGLPERTIKEAQVMEFGPVTFPAYAGAKAGVRSLTDEFVFDRFTDDPKKLAQIIDFTRTTNTANTPPKEPAAPVNAPRPKGRASAASPPQRKEAKVAVDIDRFTSVETLNARKAEVLSRREYLNAEYAGQQFPPEVQSEWEELKAEKQAIEERVNHLEEREAEIADQVEQGKLRHNDTVQRGFDPQPFQTRTRKVENIYDLSEYRTASSSRDEHTRLLRDGVKRSIDTTDIPLVGLNGLTHERAQAKALRTLGLDRHGALAEYLLLVGSPTYRTAFGKFAHSSPAQAMFAPDEAAKVQEAIGAAERAFTLGSTGLPVPYQLDPTIIPISNGSVNPFRSISRIVQTTVNEWRGATSAGITAQYEVEAAEAPDDTPTLAQPAIPAVRADAFIPFSFEVGQDWPEVESEMAREVADAKDDLEALKFTLGTGTNEPQGIIVGATTLVITTTTGAFVVADLYKLEEALGPRFRARSSVIGNRFAYNKVRQFDTAGGSGVWIPVGLQAGLPNDVPTPGRLGYGVLGYPTFEDSAMDAALTTGSEILVLGDFRYYVIVDRLGMSADVIPHLVGTNHRPTGQRGLYFFWRNGAEVINAAAFRTLQT